MTLSTSTWAFSALPEFTSPVRPHSSARDGTGASQDLTAKAAAALAEGYTRGFQAGSDEARAELQAQIQDLESHFAGRLAAEHEQWIHEFCEKVASGLESVKIQIEHALSMQLAQVIEPLFNNGLRNTAMTALMGAVNKAISEGSRIRVRAPEAIASAIKERMTPDAAECEWVFADAPDISVTVDNTKIQFIFEKWLSAIEEETA